MPTRTASDLTPAEIMHFRNTLKSRQVSGDAQMQSRLDRAHQIARRAASLLKSKFSAVRVVLFGSVINSELFHRRSDIDLAVWGIKDHDYFRAVGMLQSLDPEFSIDLIIFEEASDSLQMKILSEGTEV